MKRTVPIPNRRLMTLEEVAGYLRVHRTTLDRMIARGDATFFFRVGFRHRAFADDVDRWMHAQEELQKKPPLTLAAARETLKQIGMTLRVRDGEFRINHIGGRELSAYYTDDLQDAIDTGRQMRSHHADR